MDFVFVPHTEVDYEIANSYLSIADADAIISKQRNSAKWQGFNDETKEMLLMQSSIAIDGALMYQGAKTSEAQVLKFPRDEALALPRTIGFATAITALLFSNDDIFKNISREKIGKHETEYFAGKEIDDSVLVYLKPLKATTVKLKLGNEYE